MSYQLVEQLHKKAVPVGRLCRVLGVSRSGYYGCRQRAKLAPKACLVSTQLKAEFAASGKVYGSRRLSAVLCAQGLRTGRHRVRRLMREHGLCALWRRKFVHTTDSGHALPVSANVLARRFNPSGRVSDITYIRTRSGWLYLAVVLDLYARKVVGWSMSERITEKVAIDAMEQAVGREGSPDDGSLVFHDDQGAQYTSRSFQRCLDSHGIVQSVSRPGTPLDNAVAESFFKTLKRELVKERSYGTRDEAKQDIFKYIELYYNRVRMHSTLGYMSPVEYERQYA